MADAPAADLSVFNAASGHRTGYEWLSRDEAEVNALRGRPSPRRGAAVHAHHKILNETNRDEVTRYLLSWLEAHTA